MAGGPAGNDPDAGVHRKTGGVTCPTHLFLSAAIGVFVALAFVPMRAEAKIGSVKVNASRDYEHAAGYTYAEITIEGTVRAPTAAWASTRCPRS